MGLTTGWGWQATFETRIGQLHGHLAKLASYLSFSVACQAHAKCNIHKMQLVSAYYELAACSANM